MQREHPEVQQKVLPAPPPKQIVVVDEHGNTVGMLISNPQTCTSHAPRQFDLRIRYPVPCSKQANITTDWLKENFEENVVTSVPRSIMFEEFCNFCREYRIKPFNQAVFGKVVRACFPNLATRRLGVRGQSRYHYAGLSVKLTSRYATKFRNASEQQKLLRSHCCSQRRQVGAHVTIDGRENKPTRAVNDNDFKIAVKTSVNTWFRPLYPNADEVNLPPNCGAEEMATFLEFYCAFNQKLVVHVTGLNFMETQEHLQSFSGSIPEKCLDIMKLSDIRNIVTLCDDIMYQDAALVLLPNCLETLTTEFNVRIRKLAKSLPVWIEESGVCDTKVCYDIAKTRLEGAKKWCEYVRRVTTLCHVAREARKTLKDPFIVSQLLYDLQHMCISDIVDQCTFASHNNKVGRTKLLKIRDEATNHINHICKLLKHQASVEVYAAHVEKIVNKYAGLRPEPRVGDDPGKKPCSVIAEKTRRFVMIWAAYSSKMLTEVTLKSSESVGTFHLILLLFGDYVNHVIQLREERAKRIQLLNLTIKKGSTYFSKLRLHNANDPHRQYAPLGALTMSRKLQNITKHISSQSRQELKSTPSSNLFPTCVAQSNNKSEPAVVVEPAFSSNDSFYLLPGNGSETQRPTLRKKT